MATKRTTTGRPAAKPKTAPAKAKAAPPVKVDGRSKEARAKKKRAEARKAARNPAG